MLFRILPKEKFARLVERILESHEVIGPKQVTVDKDGKPITPKAKAPAEK